jgi:2-dehydropantoate 2-reductase
VRLAQAGHHVVCVATPLTVAAIRSRGLTLESQEDTITAAPEADEVLEEPVDLLLVTVKAPQLEAALDGIFVEPGLTLPLLNGIEHVELIRRAIEAPVAAGSIRIGAYALERAHVVQTTPFTVIRMASDDAALDGAAEALRSAGVETHVDESEKAVLWEKAVRLAALAPATALTMRTIGELRADPYWRSTMERAVEEACAVATADGAPSTAPEHWAIIDSLPDTLSTSAARDVAAARESELDAIIGGVVRAGRRLDVPTPTLDDLCERCRAL